MTHPKAAATAFPVLDLVSKRWSPYAFAPRMPPEVDLRSLFEAARWAPSSFNEQPWRYVVATKEDAAEHAKVLSCLVEGNQVWAKAAPVLALGCAALKHARNGKPNAAALHDLGLASASLTFEATARGLHVHQMIGIVPERVREVFRVPEDFQPLTGLAVGYLADPGALPENLRARDTTPRTRRPLAETVFGGTWGRPAALLGLPPSPA